jgi:hypothetical protein
VTYLLALKALPGRGRIPRNTQDRFFQLDSPQRFCKSNQVSSCWVAALPKSDIPRLDACFLTSLS